MRHSAVQSLAAPGTLAASRGHRAIPCDSLCDGLGSARECSLERFYGPGIAIGRQLHVYRIQPGDGLPVSSRVSMVLAVSLAVLLSVSRVSLGI